MVKLMTSKLLKPISSSGRKAEDNRLFSGTWIRWSALNTAERFVCANIVLLPVWWYVGLLEYMPLLLLMGIALYEWRRYGGFHLKRPSLVVVALFAFYAYCFVDTFLLFFEAHPSIDLPLGDLRSPSLNYLVKSSFELSLPCLVWYIQSNNVKVRTEVVAWACSVSVVQMLVSWLVVQFIFPGAFDHPPRTLYSMLTGKSQDYIGNAGSANYLQFYDSDGRFIFFFGNNQPSAAFIGFVGLLALDIKNRFWSLLLLGGCVFLLSLTATRSVWVAFPAVVFIRFLLTAGKVGGAWLLFAFVATVSFGTLSLPPVTNMFFDGYTGTATAVHDVRPGSSQVRGEVYKQTLKEIPDKLLFGHKVVGSPVYTTVGQGVGPEIGTHSVILGELLYLRGLVGTGFFVTFWASLIIWFYNTRVGRPMCWFPTLLFFTLISCVSFLHWMLAIGTLLCMVIRRPATKSLNRNASLCLSS